MFDWVLNTPLELLIIFANSLILDVWLGSRYWVTGFYASDMFKEIQIKCKIPVTESFLEMLQAKAKKWFLRNFWEALQRNDFLQSYFRQGLQEIPEQLYSTRAFLYLLNEMSYLPEFCDNTPILNWLASFHNFYSCNILANSIYHAGFRFISVVSITVTWASSFSGHRSKWEAEYFIFRILHMNFPNFGVKIHVLCSANSLRGFIFPYFVLM